MNGYVMQCKMPSASEVTIDALYGCLILDSKRFLKTALQNISIQ